MEDHIHGPDGHPLPSNHVEAEVAETEADANAAVQIAEIEAARDVEVTRLETRAVDTELLARIAGLEAELAALKASRMPADATPEPDVVPVVIESANPADALSDAPEDDEGELPPSDHSEHGEHPHKKKIGLGVW
jgi:hypothetical protein